MVYFMHKWVTTKKISKIKQTFWVGRVKSQHVFVDSLIQ